MSDEIINQLAAHIAADVLHQPKRMLTAEQALLSSGIVDSFSLVDLAIYVEDTFGVHLDDSELNKETFDTLGQLAVLIESRRA
jgi:acyl carrier protein